MKVSEGGSAPAAVLADVRAAVVALAEELWAAKTPDELLDANVELERLRSGIAAVQMHAAGDGDRRRGRGEDRRRVAVGG